MAMKRKVPQYIATQDLLEQMEGTMWYESVLDALSMLNEQDVRKVVHGAWISTDGATAVKCPNCDLKLPSLAKDIKGNFYPRCFCPRCGTMMVKKV